MEKNTANIDATLLMKEFSSGKHYDNIVVLCINHDLSNDILLGYYLEKMFDDLTYVAVPYDSDGEVTRDYRALLKKCYHAKKEDGEYQFYFNEKPFTVSTEDVPDCMDLLVTYAVAREIIPKIKEGKKLLVVEDGGHFSYIMENLMQIFPELEGNIIGSVEQTTSGTKLVAKQHITRYPQISVARSDVKMKFESIFIGQSIVGELNDFLRLMNITINFRHVILLGYGNIGYKVRPALIPFKCNIDVVDIEKRIRDVANKDGLDAYSCFSKELFNEDTIIIGNCGVNSFSNDDLKLFMQSKANRLYLCSGSSKDVEFRKFIDLAKGRIDDPDFKIELVEDINYHKTYNVTYLGVEKTVILICDGLPVNMIRASEFSVPDSVMDIVMTEMVACSEYLINPHNLENRLYLLGDKDSPISKEYEDELIMKWMKVNKINKDFSSLQELLEPHPEIEYLRKAIFNQ